MQTTDDGGDGAARSDAREPETARHTRAAAPVTLTAGLLSARLVGSDAREVCWAGREAVARVYVGVRDAEWGTVPADVRLVSKRRAGDAFEIRLAGRNAAPSLAVGWATVISGSADGVFRYCLVATLDELSRYNRIGLCVLHRARYLEGSSVTVRQTGGTVVRGVLPTIEPQWSVNGIELGYTEPCHRLEFTTAAGLHVVEEFEGCPFELEDERNFGDGFLKAYGPPLREGYPRQAAAGTVIRQQVTVRASDAGGGVPAMRPTRVGPGARRVRVELGSAAGTAMPHVGVDYRAVPPPAADGRGRGGRPGLAAEAMVALSPSHLRCEVDLRSPGWRRDLDAALRLGAAAGVPLEIAVAVDVPTLAGLGELARLAGQGLAGLARPRFAKPMEFAKSAGPGWAEPVARGTVARLLLGAVGGGAPTLAHLEAARRAVGSASGDADGAPMSGPEGARWALGEGAGRSVAVFAATSGQVCELIRDRPRYPGHVGVAFATNPQVHLVDDEVIFEGLFGQAAAARTVRELYPGAAVAVSPVTLRLADGPGERPPDDPRLDGMCAAAWAAGSVQALAAARVATVTFGLPLAGNGADGVLRPAFHVLAAAASMSGRPLLEVAVSEEGLARVVGVDSGDRWRVLVANVSPRSLRVDVILPGDAEVGRVWVLDEAARAGRERPIVGEPTYDAGRGAGRARPEGERACDAGPGVPLGRLHGPVPLPWRPGEMAPGGPARAFPLRLTGYGVAFFELEWH